ncbi:MAG: hypothetical protein GC152_15355 [Alphaproteobacteria bacterium]|nr:hypothetical protein [Alphaproteobacteria bacterium]
MRDLIAALNETSWSIALRESLYVWPILEATHVLTIMLFAGTIMMVDLRLLSIGFRDIPVSEMTRRILPWTVAGFIVLAATGLLLLYAKPLHYYHNVFFRLKLLLLCAALANIIYFHRKAEADMAAWASGKAPFAARASAVISLCAWVSVIIAGRMIAYDWYDCSKLNPDGALSAFADCPRSSEAVAEAAARE